MVRGIQRSNIGTSIFIIMSHKNVGTVILKHFDNSFYLGRIKNVGTVIHKDLAGEEDSLCAAVLITAMELEKAAKAGHLRLKSKDKKKMEVWINYKSIFPN